MTSRRIRNIALPIALLGIVALGYFVFRGAGDGTVIPPSRQEPVSRGTSAASHERLTSSEKYLPLGRVRLDVVSRHPSGVRRGGRTVRWYLGAGADGRLKRVRTGRIRETTPGVARMTTVLTLPQAGRFRFAARGPGGSHYLGAGVAPLGYPPRPAIESAATYLRRRTGYTSFAVVDSEGRMHGSHLHRTFVSASVVKAMLLVAYLREIAGAHRRLAETDRSLLQSMIHISDNEAATAVWERDGDQRLRALAQRAGMTDFSIEGEWGNAQLSAADQAHYFFEMDSLIPARFRHFADHLLSHIAGYESWGIPSEARPRGWTVFFKGGWRGTWRGQLVHQIARLRKPHERVAIAVMTDGDPSMEYGIETIQGVAARLLPRRSVHRAGFP
jgi:hypothetical protein